MWRNGKFSGIKSISMITILISMISFIMLSFTTVTSITVMDRNIKDISSKTSKAKDITVKTSQLNLKIPSPPLKIAIVDSGLNRTKNDGIQLCDSALAVVDFTGTGNEDNMGHGTNIANIIASKLKGLNYCFYIFKAFDPNNKREVTQSLIWALEYVYVVRPFVVNISAGGPSYLRPEYSIVEDILDHTIQINAAAGNNMMELNNKSCDYYPACYDTRINVVGNLNSKSSNYGPRVRFWEDGNNITAGGYTMSGTSQATALFTGNMVKKVLESRYEK